MVGAGMAPTPAPTAAAPAQPARRNGPASRGGGGVTMGGYGAPGAGMMGGYPGTQARAGYGSGGYGGGYPGMGGYGGRPAAGGQTANVEDPTARAADARTTQLLRKALTIDFDNVGLDDVLRFVADNAQVDVVVDWKGLEAAGVEKGAPVSLQLRQGAPAEQVLTWVLRSATGDAAGFTIDHGVVLVAPQDRINRMVVTRAYPLGDLAGQGGDLEQLVRETVAPGAWRESGGPGSVRCFNGQLFVTATEPNHRQIERLLGLMQAQGVAPRGGGGAMMQGMMPGMGGGMPGMAPGAMPAK
jgi:hypothetical protein